MLLESKCCLWYIEVAGAYLDAQLITRAMLKVRPIPSPSFLEAPIKEESLLHLMREAKPGMFSEGTIEPSRTCFLWTNTDNF
jgi:hypothetical protein